MFGPLLPPKPVMEIAPSTPVTAVCVAPVVPASLRATPWLVPVPPELPVPCRDTVAEPRDSTTAPVPPLLKRLMPWLPVPLPWPTPVREIAPAVLVTRPLLVM